MNINTPLHVGAPNIGDRQRFHEYVDEIFDRRWLTNRGVVVQEFERRLTDFLGVRHCIPMCNGTVALEIAIRALGLTGEVIVPALTFVATAHALQWQAIQPVFCDVDPHSCCIDPACVQRCITEKTTGIIGVHIYGRPCDTETLSRIAAGNGLRLMFDAAHAFGCSHDGRMIGSFGDCEVFSFHATKIFNTFEGGAIATNDDELAAKIRLMQNFGFDGEDHVVYLGTNGKMCEINAAMGLGNLDCLDRFLEVNRRNYETYREGIRGIDGLKLLEYDETEKRNWQYVMVVVGGDYPLARDELIERLRARGVLARRYFWPGCHKMEPYRTLQPGVSLPVTEALLERVIALPTGTQTGGDDVRKIVEMLHA